MALPPYRPTNGARVSFDAGVWSAAGRPTVRVTVEFDARLLMDFVLVAARNPTSQASFGLGVPPAKVTLS